jgi:hypothetical protein
MSAEANSSPIFLCADFLAALAITDISDHGGCKILFERFRKRRIFTADAAIEEASSIGTKLSPSANYLVTTLIAVLTTKSTNFYHIKVKTQSNYKSINDIRIRNDHLGLTWCQAASVFAVQKESISVMVTSNMIYSKLILDGVAPKILDYSSYSCTKT